MDLPALDRLLQDVGDRWSLLLVAALTDGSRTFADLREVGISPAVLSSRLKDLEAAGLVEATPYQDRPVRHRYGLTRTGARLVPAVRLLAHVGGDEVTHAPCGTTATPAWWCPTCDLPVDPADADLVRL